MRPPSGKERALNWAIGLGVLIAFPFLVGGVVWLAFAEDDPSGIDCASYEFDPDGWNGDAGDREYEAAGLERCRSLDGSTRGEVGTLLGEPRRVLPRNRWSYDIGTFDDLMDGLVPQRLIVYFDSSGQVTRTRFVNSTGGYAAD